MVRRQFRSTATGTLHEQWLGHKKNGSVVEYRRKFIELLAPLERVPEEIAKGQFLNALKEEIKVEVRLLGPKSLDNTMDLALMVEDKLRVGSNKRLEQGLAVMLLVKARTHQQLQHIQIEVVCQISRPVLGILGRLRSPFNL